MGHSRQSGGFRESPAKPLEGYPEGGGEVRGLRPDPRADTSGPRDGLQHLRPDMPNLPVFTPYRPPRPEKSEGGHQRCGSSRRSSRRATSRRRSTSCARGSRRGERDQVLLGVTGSGKTFTMAHVIERNAAPGDHPRAEQDIGGAALRRDEELLSRRTRSSISSPITITTSRKPMSRAPTPMSRRNPR